MKSKSLLLSAAIISFLGFADSAYLTAEHYFKLPLPCSLTQGCDTVLTSPYSMVGPVPLAFFGVLYYLAVLVLVIHCYTSREFSPVFFRLIFGLTVIGFLSSAYFVYLQLFVIGALCMYCLGSTVTSTLLLIVSSSLIRGFREPVAVAQ